MEKFIFCAVQNGVSKTFKRQVIHSLIPGKGILWWQGEVENMKFREHEIHINKANNFKPL